MAVARVRLAIAVVLPVAFVVGCGSEFADVHGTVTLDGQNIANAPDVRGTVLFSPAQPGQGLAAGNGTLETSGEYTIFVGTNEGLRAGLYLVTVSVTKIIPSKTPGNPPSGQPITPPKYANPKLSGLRADVKPGSNTFDFALTSAGNH